MQIKDKEILLLFVFKKKEPIKITDPHLALVKMQGWCAYQERSQQEARDKLYELGMWTDAVENIISQLIQDNFLNEERFAIAFAGGKFRIKKWGKIKIKIELRQRKVSDYCINKALKQIPDKDYFSTLEKIIQQKSKLVKETNKIKRHNKLIQYAASRGFEKDLIVDVLKEIEK